MLKTLLVDIIAAPEVYKKIIGMQMLVEGLAMGAFATYYQNIADPLGKKLMQLVMTDEAFHQIRENLGRPHHPEADDRESRP